MYAEQTAKVTRSDDDELSRMTNRCAADRTY
jgi:hypothetical protein